MVNGWKILAIICILLIIAETGLFCYIFNLGVSEINNEIKCSEEICFSKGADNYYYDSI